MAGAEKMACPDCGTVNAMIGVFEGTRQYVCKACGQVYYTPDGCLDDKKGKEGNGDRRGDDDRGPQKDSGGGRGTGRGYPEDDV